MNWFTSDWEFWINRYQTLEAAAVAIAAGYIAYRQLRETSQEKMIGEVLFLEQVSDQHLTLLAVLDDAHDLIAEAMLCLDQFDKSQKLNEAQQTASREWQLLKQRATECEDNVTKAGLQRRLYPKAREKAILAIQVLQEARGYMVGYGPSIKGDNPHAWRVFNIEKSKIGMIIFDINVIAREADASVGDVVERIIKNRK